MPIIDSQYTDPDALRSLYMNPKNVLKYLEDVAAKTTAGEPEVIITPPVQPPVVEIPPCFLGHVRVDLNENVSMPFEALWKRRKTWIGSSVLSFDDDGNIRPDTIVNIFRHRVYEYQEVGFASDGNEVLPTTKEHPFWSDRREFVPAGNFRLGDRFHERVADVGSPWRLTAVTSLRRVSVPKGVWVYNLTTAIYHHYFANKKAVHNSKLPPDGDTRTDFDFPI